MCFDTVNTKAEIRFHVDTADWLPQRIKDKVKLQVGGACDIVPGACHSCGHLPWGLTTVVGVVVYCSKGSVSTRQASLC